MMCIGTCIYGPKWSVLSNVLDEQMYLSFKNTINNVWPVRSSQVCERLHVLHYLRPPDVARISEVELRVSVLSNFCKRI